MPLTTRPNSLSTSIDLTIDSKIENQDEIVALENNKNPDNPTQEEINLNSLVAFIQDKFERAKNKRFTDEQRWLQSFRNYRGEYGPDVQFTETEKSRAFIKITKTKVLAAYAQIIDILFSGAKFPIGVEPTKVPLGLSDAVHFDPKEPEGDKSAESAPQRSATIARPGIEETIKNLGPLKNYLSRIPDEKIKEGPGLTPTAYTWEPAREAAKAMDATIQDQLDDSNAVKEIRHMVFEMCLFGTGLFKGPLAMSKEYPRWDSEGKYDPLFKTIAKVGYVSIWDAYPDPDAFNMQDAESFIERHRMTKTEIRSLKKRPYFREDAVDKCIDMGVNYVKEYWETEIQETQTQPESIDRFEVLEYWGIVDKEIAEECGLDIPKDMRKHDQLQVNAWICNDQILRLVLNPFTPAHIPYYACPYELSPYSFFGIGVADNMADTQLLMNGFMRMAVDNGVLSGNLIFEIDETNLVPGQDMSLYPGKIFRRQAGAPGQALFGTKYPNTTQENLALFDKARQLADESTGIPSYSHGQSGIQGVGRTAAGMSMLMGAAAQNIKAVVKNIDDYLLVPLGRALFAFNMQFNFDPKYIGEVEVVAHGTDSLMRNEVRGQKILQFMQVTSNPMDAPYTKRDYLLRELAQSLDLDPEKTVNDPREAGIQAEVMAKMHAAMGPAAPQPGTQAPNPSGAPSPQDPTGNGGGNIAPGQAPNPGMPGNTGAGGGDNGGNTSGQPQNG